MISPKSPLPLPADRPHVGPYRTNFDWFAAAGSPAVRARLIDRTLPVRRKAIDARNDAVEAARLAYEAASDAYQTGGVGVSTVLDSLDLWSQQRRAFLAAVCDYNHDIADYALAVVGPVASGPSVGRHVDYAFARQHDAGHSPGHTLLGASQWSASVSFIGAQGASMTPSGVRPAMWDEPALGSSKAAGAFRGNRPAIPPTDKSSSAGSTDAGNDDGAAGPAIHSILAPPDGGGVNGPVPRAARKPVPAAEGGGTAVALYALLFDAKPAVCAKQLAQRWRASAGLPEKSGEPIDLAVCLRRLLGTDRRGLLEAYWAVWQREAEWQALTEQDDLLRLVNPVTLERRSHPHERLCFLADQQAGTADQYDAQVRLLQAQFELTRRTDRPLDGPWLFPSTVPHAAPYNLKVAAQDVSLAGSWRFRRLAMIIPSLYENLQERAVAVVTADRARQPDLAAYQAGQISVGQVLFGIRQQTAETMAYLATATDYNRAIADYALTVLPATLAPEEVASSLVFR